MPIIEACIYRIARRSLSSAGLWPSPMARVVDVELGHLAGRTAVLPIVGAEPGAAVLRLLDAFLDAVNEIGPAGADVGTEHIRAVALVMHAAGERAPLVRHGRGIAENV